MSDSISDADRKHGARFRGDGAAQTPEASGTPRSGETPTAVEEQSLRRRAQGSLRQSYLPKVDQVRWVRASDVLSSASGQAAGHGIRLTRAVHRPNQLLKPPARRGPQTGESIRSDRASRLAPLSAFGAGANPQGSAMSIRR